jgi:FUN14 family protein
MSSLYTHAFLRQAALRLSFRHSLKRTTYLLQKAPITSPLQARISSNHVKPLGNGVAAAVGTGLASVGLGLSLYANFQRLNCESECLLVPGNESWLRTGKARPTASSQSHSTAALGTPDLAPLPPPPESAVNMYELTFGTVCGVCAGIFVKKGAKTLAFIFGGVFVLLQVSALCISHGMLSPKSAHVQLFMNSILPVYQ